MNLQKFLFYKVQFLSDYKSILVLFFLFGVIFLTIGILFLTDDAQIIEIFAKYNEICEKDYPNTSQCIISFDITQKMQKPIYVFYEIENFPQISYYVSSKSIHQLNGHQINQDQQELNECGSIKKNKNIAANLQSWDSQPLNPEDIANPCGAYALTQFKDSFELFASQADLNSNTPITINQNGISIDSEKYNKFNYLNKDIDQSKQKQWVNPLNEHFINWMVQSGLYNVRKLYGRIEIDLEPKNYKIKIQNLFQIKNLGISKLLVFSTVGNFGGKNKWIYMCYSVVGFLLLIMSFYVYYLMGQNKNVVKIQIN